MEWNEYLFLRAFGAADSDDLFEALQEAETEGYILPYHVYVKDIMDTWVEQMGYPVVTVTRNYTTATTEISQERFLIGEASSTDDHDYKWWVPLNWVSQASPDFSATVAQDWIRSQDESVMLSGLNASGWVIFNKQQTGQSNYCMYDESHEDRPLNAHGLFQNSHQVTTG